jgi:hypothetical protein
VDVVGEVVTVAAGYLPWYLAVLLALAVAVLVVLGRRVRLAQLEVERAPEPVSDGGTAADAELRTKTWQKGNPDPTFTDAG